MLLIGSGECAHAWPRLRTEVGNAALAMGRDRVLRVRGVRGVRGGRFQAATKLIVGLSQAPERGRDYQVSMATDTGQGGALALIGADARATTSEIGAE